MTSTSEMTWKDSRSRQMLDTKVGRYNAVSEYVFAPSETARQARFSGLNSYWYVLKEAEGKVGRYPMNVFRGLGVEISAHFCKGRSPLGKPSGSSSVTKAPDFLATFILPSFHSQCLHLQVLGKFRDFLNCVHMSPRVSPCSKVSIHSCPRRAVAQLHQA